jgi:hypothetical protein
MFLVVCGPKALITVRAKSKRAIKLPYTIFSSQWVCDQPRSSGSIYAALFASAGVLRAPNAMPVKHNT